ncbi:MAG TPA: hypothetical protein VGS02_16785 [Acidobacteriaceae bacterium]|nr:hypothetical protein [Acidobacteriaceae bacterium]
MLLEVSVNDGPPVRASLNRTGVLSAHLNVRIGTDETDAATIVLNSFDKTDEPNSVYSKWELGSLSAGDRIEIRLQQNGEGDPPTEVWRSAESPNNLFSNPEQARLLLTAISACDSELNGLLISAKAAEPKEEFEKISRAVFFIIGELDRCLISPTLRRHPELLEEAKQKKLV